MKAPMYVPKNISQQFQQNHDYQIHQKRLDKIRAQKSVQLLNWAESNSLQQREIYVGLMSSKSKNRYNEHIQTQGKENASDFLSPTSANSANIRKYQQRGNTTNSTEELLKLKTRASEKVRRVNEIRIQEENQLLVKRLVNCITKNESTIKEQRAKSIEDYLRLRKHISKLNAYQADPPGKTFDTSNINSLFEHNIIVDESNENKQQQEGRPLIKGITRNDESRLGFRQKYNLIRKESNSKKPITFAQLYPTVNQSDFLIDLPNVSQKLKRIQRSSNSLISDNQLEQRINDKSIKNISSRQRVASVRLPGMKKNHSENINNSSFERECFFDYERSSFSELTPLRSCQNIVLNNLQTNQQLNESYYSSKENDSNLSCNEKKEYFDDEEESQEQRNKQEGNSELLQILQKNQVRNYINRNFQLESNSAMKKTCDSEDIREPESVAYLSRGPHRKLIKLPSSTKNFQQSVLNQFQENFGEEGVNSVQLNTIPITNHDFYEQTNSKCIRSQLSLNTINSIHTKQFI